MEIFDRAAAAQAQAAASDQRRVLVPTMGALHRGHLELVRMARQSAGDQAEVVVSIFVNPLQFEPGSDFERYPRPAAHDEELLREAGVDVLYRPGPDEMYAADRSVYVEETSLSETLCGRSRPGHFRGVCTVVAKLFNLLAPEAAVFGEKDFQQLAIIRRMVRDLDFPIEIIGAPIVREEDGLALSSRNQYLSAEERAQATILSAACAKARDMTQRGEKSGERLLEAARTVLAEAPLARIDYVEIVNAETLRPITHIEAPARFALAVFFGKTRLIDNIALA